MKIKKFEKFEKIEINEGINTEELSEEQRAALKEIQESDLSVLDDRDMQHYADKIGVSIEDLAGYLADSGMPNTTEEEEEVEDNSELEDLVQKELVDNEEVNAGNLMYKIQEIVDRLENDDYYEWGDEEWDEYLGKYETLADTIKKMYDELTGVNNPNQTSMKFESIKRFSDFVNEHRSEDRTTAKFYNHILQGEYATDENYIIENSQWSDEEWDELERKHAIAKEIIKNNAEDISRYSYDSFTLFYANNYETIIYKNVGALNAPKTELSSISGDTIVGVSSQNGSLGTLYKLTLINLDGKKIGEMSTWKFPYFNSEYDFTKLAYIKKSFGRFESVKIY